MNIAYEKIKDVLSHDNISEFVPLGVFYSKAIISLFQDKIVDCFFLYSYNMRTEVVSTPYARIAIDFTNKSLAYYHHVDDKPFMQSIPEDFFSSIIYDDIHKNWQNIYEKYYVEIRNFVFQENISDVQKAVLQDYKSSFEYIIDKEIQPYYYELSPGFWNWLEKMLG